MDPQALAKSSLIRILLPLAVLFALAFLAVRQADTLLGLALRSAFGEHASQFESVWFEWDGDVVAKQVVLHPNDIGDVAAVRFERVWLETPGWGFFLRNAFDRTLAKARLERIHLVFGEATMVDGLEALLPEFGPVGASSAAVFETEGCGSATHFTRDHLVEMGLSPGTTSLEIDQRIAGDALQVTIALATPGSSRTQLDRSGRVDAPLASLLGARPLARYDAERWLVRDEGFVSARNRFCAQQDGVTPREVLERHIAAIDRLLQRAGLAVDDNAHAFYRRFARSGGEMAFGGGYQPPLTDEESMDSRDDGRALARMNATLERDTRAVPIVWRMVTPLPAPVVVAPPEPVVAEPPVVVSEPPVVVAPEPAVVEVVTPAVVEEPKPEPPPVVVPPKPARASGPRIERVAAAVKRPALGFDDLSRYQGRRVRLWTVHNPPRLVEILEASGDQVRVRVKLVGGQAEYTVSRSGFLRASALD